MALPPPCPGSSTPAGGKYKDWAQVTTTTSTTFYRDPPADRAPGGGSSKDAVPGDGDIDWIRDPCQELRAAVMAYRKHVEGLCCTAKYEGWPE